jgi:hypothetical protein
MTKFEDWRRGNAAGDPDLAGFRSLMTGLQSGGFSSGGAGGSSPAGEPGKTDDPLEAHADLVRAIRAALPEEDVPKDFTARVMRQIRHPAARWREQAWGVAWRAAAAVALLLAAGALLVRGLGKAPAWRAAADAASAAATAEAGSADDSPLAYLALAQRADGSWGDTGSQAADFRPRYGTGISSLALLAVVMASPDALSGEHGPVVRRGVAHLMAAMDGEGHVGAAFTGADFNQYLAAKALAAAAALPGAPEEWGRAAALALRKVPDDPLSRERLAAMNRRLAHEEASGAAAWESIGGPVLAAALQVIRNPSARRS